MRIVSTIIFLCVILTLFTTSVFSDIVIFKTGERKTGLVKELKDEPDYVLFINSKGELRIPHSRISRIIKEDPDVNYSHIAEGYIKIKDFLKARQYVDLAIQANPESKDVATLHQRLELEIKKESEKKQSDEKQKISLDIQKIEELIDEDSFEEAQDILKLNGKKELSEDQAGLLKVLYVKLYHEWGLSNLDHLNPNGAAEKFEKALALDPDNQDILSKLVAIWEKNPKMAPEVIQIYTKQFEQDPENIDLARKLADLHYSIFDYEGALPYLLIINKKTSGQDSITRSRLMETLDRLRYEAASKQRFDIAQKYYKMILDIFPGKDPTPYYYYQFKEKEQKLEKDDYDAMIELGNFCSEHHLDSEARKLYRDVLKKDPDNIKALNELKKYASRDLEEAEVTFRRKDYDTTLNLSGQIIVNYIRFPDVQERAKELMEKAENEIRRENREKAERGIALARRGDEYYAQAQYHMNAMKSTERRDEIRVVNDKEEAKKFLRRAISAWETAIKIDPKLARVDSEDLGTKLRDARLSLQSLTTVRPIPDTYKYKKRSMRNQGIY
jgi:tetratricopeptide (TPR) repeat protein